MTGPLVELLDGRLLVKPAICDLADELDITETPETDKLYDVAIVGAGGQVWPPRSMPPLRVVDHCG